MKNKEIAAIFESVADLMEILGEDRFRINSYRKVSRIVGDLTEANIDEPLAIMQVDTPFSPDDNGLEVF